MRSFLLAALACLLLGPAAGRARAAALTAQGAAVLDSGGAPRATFSSNETIGFSQTVHNGVASPNRTTFMFEVVAPNANTVFRHSGNAVPGSVGNASARITGIAISGFYQGPGTYTMRATAALDGTPLQQTATFTLSSPNILLIYPPNGSTGLSDNPLTFQWFSSGAATYRISVGDNPSLYNAFLVQAAGAGSSFTYPQNPTDDRQKLAAGQTYYWKVEGLDINGNVVAQSQVPYSFGVQTVSNTRDLAIDVLEVAGSPDSAGVIPFTVTVKNQGTTTETAVPLKFTIGGLPVPGTPIELPALTPGQSKTYSLSGAIPADQGQGLVIACLTIFDDTVANNCKTLTVARPPVIAPDTGSPGGVPLTAEQIWEAIKQLLKEQGIDLTEYDLVSIEGSMTRDELAALLDQLRQGQASAVITGPPLAAAPPPPLSAAPAPYVPDDTSPAAAAPPAAVEESSSPEEETASEWSGMAVPLAARTMTLTISDASRWKKLWTRLSDQPVPNVDFARYKVAAVLVGRGVNVDRVAVDGLVPSGQDLIVRYRLVKVARFGRANAADQPGTRLAPFLLKIVPRDVAAVRFQQTKEDEE